MVSLKETLGQFEKSSEITHSLSGASPIAPASPLGYSVNAIFHSERVSEFMRNSRATVSTFVVIAFVQSPSKSNTVPSEEIKETSKFTSSNLSQQVNESPILLADSTRMVSPSVSLDETQPLRICASLGNRSGSRSPQSAANSPQEASKLGECRKMYNS